MVYVQVERDTEEPVYQQIADDLARRIRAGEWRPGHRVASEAAVVQEYGVARATARKAFGVLRGQGLIRTIPGRGHFRAG